MRIFPLHRKKGSSGLSSPLWHRLSSLAVLLFAIGLFLLSLKSDIYHSRLSAVLVSCLLVALGGALFLHIYSFMRSEKEKREADRVFHITNCESTSIFQNVLDGILILDDQGVCQDSNPAGLSILGVSREQLIGQPFGRFYTDRDVFGRNWDSFKQTQYQRGRSELVDRKSVV